MTLELSAVIITIAFLWLCVETKWFTVRLEQYTKIIVPDIPLSSGLAGIISVVIGVVAFVVIDALVEDDNEKYSSL